MERLAGMEEKLGVPVEARVAEILDPTRPALPMPVTTAGPRRPGRPPPPRRSRRCPLAEPLGEQVQSGGLEADHLGRLVQAEAFESPAVMERSAAALAAQARILGGRGQRGNRLERNEPRGSMARRRPILSSKAWTTSRSSRRAPSSPSWCSPCPCTGRPRMGGGPPRGPHGALHGAPDPQPDGPHRPHVDRRDPCSCT